MSTQAALVEAWAYWDDKPSGETSSAGFHAAVAAFATEHDLSPLLLRSEMARMRRTRPQPERAAVLQAIVAEHGSKP